MAKTMTGHSNEPVPCLPRQCFGRYIFKIEECRRIELQHCAQVKVKRPEASQVRIFVVGVVKRCNVLQGHGHLTLCGVEVPFPRRQVCSHLSHIDAENLPRK